MKLTVKDFLNDTINQCIENNVEFKLLKKENLEGSAGSFTGNSDDGCELCCILDRDDWLEILVHETCHMDQYIEKSPLWFHELVDLDHWDKMILKFVDNDIVLDAFKKITELEIDCDKRVLKKIKKYSLDIDIPQYIKRSNCYHQSYYYFHKFEIFYDLENTPYNDVELFESFDGKKILDLDEIWCENPQLEKFLVQNNTKL
jgi:hypothetical protein